MRNKKMSEGFKSTLMRAGSLVLAAAVVIGSSVWTYERQNAVPELVTFVDTQDSIQIEEDEVPLGKPTVTKSTKTKKKTKKIKLKKASEKTYKKKGKSKTSKKTSRRKTSLKATTTETVTQTSVTNQYKKGSKINTQVTTEKTTVTTTVTPLKSENTERLVVNTSTVENTAPEKTYPEISGSADLAQIASEADSRVLSAFKKLGFQVTVKANVPYSGLFDARTQSITLRRADSTVYHELGHFLSFVAGNMDSSAEFTAIYQKEKGSYTAMNKAYVTSSSAEYFAESFRNYTEAPSALKAERPETYAAIQTAMSRITDAQISRILSVYGSVWGA